LSVIFLTFKGATLVIPITAKCFLKTGMSA